MKSLKKYGKLIAFDSLAVLCFIGVILFGWIPGPGGIPLFILGLSLLAVNHDWAERWLEKAKHKGVTFKKWLFPDVQWIRYAYDAGSIVVFGAGAYYLFNTNARFQEGIAVGIMIFSLFIFLLNRQRLDKISNLFRNKQK